MARCKGLQRQLPFQPVTCCPANNPTGEEVQDDGQIQPAFGGPDIADVNAPFLIRPIAGKILIQEIGRNRAAMVAVRGLF